MSRDLDANLRHELGLGSFGEPENSLDELAPFKGATIAEIQIRDDGFGGKALVLGLSLTDDLEDQHGNRSTYVEVEVWQDSEGNGPGFLALTAVGPDARTRRSS